MSVSASNATENGGEASPLSADLIQSAASSQSTASIPLSRRSTDVPSAQSEALDGGSINSGIADAHTTPVDPLQRSATNLSAELQTDSTIVPLPREDSRWVNIDATTMLNRVDRLSRGLTKRYVEHYERSEFVLPEQDMFAEEYMLPLGFVCQGLRQAARDGIVKRGCADFIVTFLFAVLTLLVNPVSSIFEIHDGISQSLVHASINATGFQSKMTFNTVKSYTDLWMWVNHVLYPKVYHSAAYLGSYGQSNTFSIAKYNRLVTPIRFRQVRVKRDECSTLEENHMLARPCWPAYFPHSSLFSSAIDEVSVPNSTFHADGTSLLLGENEYLGTHYGTSGHVVDLELDPVLALAKLQGMVKQRWTDEYTQAVGIDMNTYNPNYNMATVFRFKVVRDIGGKLEPHVETCSYSPNRSSRSGVAALEYIWGSLFTIYVFVTAFLWCRQGICRSFRSMSCRLQLFSILWLGATIAFYVMHVLEDQSFFQSRHVTEFKDMYSVCHSFNVAGNFASLGMVMACFQLVRAFRAFESFSHIYELLARCARVVFPFLLNVLLGLILLSFSAMWLFGARVRGLHTWYHSLGVLAHSMATGKHSLFTYEGMKDANTSVAGIWMITWILLSSFIFFNMFVSCSSQAASIIRKKISLQQRYQTSFPTASFLTYLKSKVPCLWRDPDTIEPIHKLLHEVNVWNAHLCDVDAEKLQEIVDMLICEGQTLLRVQHLMPLFIQKDEKERYCRAAAWIKSLSTSLGVRMADTEHVASVPFEVKMLAQGFGKLEEEIYGLGHQLRRVLPNGAPKAPTI